MTIQTADGYSVTLTHLGSTTLRRGETVSEGASVGTIGPSGDVEHDVPYVHLGVRRSEDPNGYVDPLLFLPAQPAPAGPSPAPPPVRAPAPPPASPSTSAPPPPAATAPPAGLTAPTGTAVSVGADEPRSFGYRGSGGRGVSPARGVRARSLPTVHAVPSAVRTARLRHSVGSRRPHGMPAGAAVAAQIPHD